MAEMIDIYDANLRHLGTMERLRAHLEGHWHKTFHCWIATTQHEGAVLFQLRSSEVANYPNMLDISAAGHLEAGEGISEGIREVCEELGVPILIEELHSLGYRVEVADQSNGQKNREYQAVYLAQLDTPLSEFDPQVEEVAGLLWLKVQDGLDLFSDTTKNSTMWGIRYNPEQGVWEETTRVVTSDDFLPRIQNYYLTICIMAERLLAKRFPLAIS